MTIYWAYQCASWLSRTLPSACAYWLGVRVADLFYWRDQEGRCAVLQNLRRIHEAQGRSITDRALQSMARATYRCFGKYLVDFFRLGDVSDVFRGAEVCIEHEDYLADCVARGRGVILVTGHFGNWELGGAVLAARGHEVHAVVLPYRSEKVERLFNHYRERRGIHTVPFGHAARDLVRYLQEGKMVALLADRDFSAHQHEATFFNRVTSMPRGPAWLAMKTGAPVLPAFMIRQPDDSFLLRFHAPLFPEALKTEDRIRDRICAGLEREIGEQPHQWFIFEDFWDNENGRRGHRHG